VGEKKNSYRGVQSNPRSRSRPGGGGFKGKKAGGGGNRPGKARRQQMRTKGKR
jgi:hypothetical protein